MTNSYSSSNDSALQSNISVMLPFSRCFFLRPSGLVYFANDFVRILILLPLCILVLCIGLKRKQQQRSNSMAPKMSHSDYFTYHLVVMELIGVSGLVLCCCGVFTLHVKTFLVGMQIFSVAWYGELFFQMLTCVEHFLAVVHPITYVSLKSERGVQIRNICSGVVWPLSVGAGGLPFLSKFQADFFLVTFTLVVISLCSLSVLYVLIRPRPGEQGADRERINQSKKRAFFTIVLILGVLLLKCVWSLTWASISVVQPNLCMIMAFGDYLNTPSSLILPLMFLQRDGLLICCRKVK